MRRPSVRRSSPQEVRKYGVRIRVESAWREPQQSVETQAFQAKRRIGPNRTAYIQEYADMLGITLEEAKARLIAQRRRSNLDDDENEEDEENPSAAGTRDD